MARGRDAGNEVDGRNDIDATEIVPIQRVQSLILLVRGQKVILDSDMAALYDVPTKRLNEQVRRNIERFPGDFMFQLTAEEIENLRSQFATSSLDWGGRRYRPYAFTEHGAIMAASVLNSPQAVQTSIYVVRAFVRPLLRASDLSLVTCHGSPRPPAARPRRRNRPKRPSASAEPGRIDRLHLRT